MSWPRAKAVVAQYPSRLKDIVKVLNGQSEGESVLRTWSEAPIVEIKLLKYGRAEKSLFRHGLDAIQEAIKSFGDGALERFVEIFADCVPWKTRAQLTRNSF